MEEKENKTIPTLTYRTSFGEAEFLVQASGRTMKEAKKGMELLVNMFEYFNKQTVEIKPTAEDKAGRGLG